MQIVRKISCVTVVRISAESHATRPKLGQAKVKSGISVETGAVKKERETVTLMVSAKETSYVLMKCARIQDSPWPELAITLIAAVRHRDYRRLFHQLI